MNIRNRREIRQTARRALDTAHGSPGTVALVYGSIICLLALVSNVISFILENQIAGTGGLRQMTLRSLLSTIQALLPLIQVLVAIGLDLGYCRAMLDVSRGRSTEPRTLFFGFSRYGTIFRAALLEMLIYIGIMIAAVYLSIWIFMLLPVSESFYALAEPLLDSMMDSSFVLDEATLLALGQSLIPCYCILAVVCLAAIIPVTYQYRMVSFCVSDGTTSALAAMRESRQMMRRNRFALFRLDLGFWWYYLLQVLISVICYGDLLLSKLGVALPWSDTISYFLFLILSLALQMVSYALFMNRITVTYAAAYDTLRPKPQSGGVVLGNIFDM